MSKNSKNIEKTTSIRGLEDKYIPYTAGGVGKELFTNERGVNLDTLYNVVKTSPEVVGAIQAIIEDIMADGWRFDGSKNAIKKSEAFVVQSQFYKILTNALLDLIITGNAYILKLSVDESKLSSLITSLTKNLGKELKVKFEDDSVYELIEQEDFSTPNDLQVLKSSTMKINFDETGLIKSYVQSVNGIKRTYRPKDIIHLSLMNIGGEPYGFSGLEPLLSDLATLIFAKEYVGKFFENDGTPKFIFKMPDESPDGRNYELLKKELKELQKKENKYRNMAITGNIEVEQISSFDKDMEYPKLISHFTQIILIALGVPAHRINYTIDVESQGQAVNRAYEGYYKKISFMQKVIENALNKDLWRSFNSKMTFKRSYKIDEMREAQIIQILTQVGAITIEEAREMMGMDRELPKGTTPNKTGDDKRINFNEDKRQEEGRPNNGESADQNTDNKVKTINKNFQDAIEVDNLQKFKMIVEGRVGEGAFDKANIVYLETDLEFVMFFSDGNWTYKVRVSKEDIEDIEAFRYEYLRNAIPLKL